LEILLGHSRGRHGGRKIGIIYESSLGDAHYLFTQRRNYELAGGENSTDEGNLKSLLIHFKFANDGNRRFAELITGVRQNVSCDFIVRTRSFDHKFTEAGNPIICDRWPIDRGGQIVRCGDLKEFARGFG
jgi:hypothetical protein